MRTRRRRYLVSVSLTIHLAIVLALFVAGVWRIDRLDAPRHTIDLAVALPPPPAPSGSPSATPVEFKKKQKTITHDITIPTKPDRETPPTPAADKPGTGSGSGDGSGSGSGSGKDPNSTCTENCGPDTSTTVEKKEEPKPPKEPVTVVPTVIRGMRISGETQIQMGDAEKTSLIRSGKPRTMATAKVCIGETGSVTSLAMFRGSGYAGWDAAILGAMRSWRYKPHQIDGRAVPVCGMVTFVYEIH